MNHVTSRRRLLSFGGSIGLLLVSGCFGADADPSPGSLVLRNNHDRTHTLTLEVTVAGEPRTDAFTLEEDETQTQSEYLTEPGTYSVTVTADTGESQTVDIELEASERSSTGLTGDMLEIIVSEEGSLISSVGIYD